MCIRDRINGAPFSPDYALVKWSDTSSGAITSLKYMGFTTGMVKGSIDYGANCVLLKTQIGIGQAPYSSITPEQIQALYPNSRAGSVGLPPYQQQFQVRH